jgi:hypothetical protein
MMITRTARSVLVLSAALVLAVSGCAAPRVDVASWESTHAADPPADEPPSELELQDENVPIAIGEVAVLYGGMGQQLASFTVTEIVVDPLCDVEPAPAPVNGHFVALRFDVETSAELARDPVPFLTFAGYFWRAFDAEGAATVDVVGHSPLCFDDTQLLPFEIGPDQRVSGLVVLDVTATSGLLVYNPFVSGGGWEWSYEDATVT